MYRCLAAVFFLKKGLRTKRIMTTIPLILFDGDCNFCNSSVNFVIKHDKQGVLKFLPLRSLAAKQLLEQYRLESDSENSFVFIENGFAYTRSTAALKVCRYLNALWPWCYGSIILPKFLRDSIYNVMAKNRHKWFGNKQDCLIPTHGLMARFLK